MTEKAKSDLGVRTISAVAMLLVAGGAIWAGGLLFNLFVLLVGIGIIWEYWGLVRAITSDIGRRAGWMLFGLCYIGLAIFALVALRSAVFGVGPLLMVMGAVIATDVGAYFSGRLIGGPKIAPKISPSKTWAGLGGGMLGAALVMLGGTLWQLRAACFDISVEKLLLPVFAGMAIAIMAQAGDFFESWMKRRAGVKDSGKLIPGHGGLFDRVDGLIAVLFAGSIIVFLAARLG